jgi:hypothetical protein
MGKVCSTWDDHEISEIADNFHNQITKNVLISIKIRTYDEFYNSKSIHEIKNMDRCDFSIMRQKKQAQFSREWRDVDGKKAGCSKDFQKGSVDKQVRRL